MNEENKEEGKDGSCGVDKTIDPQSDHTPMTSSRVDQSKHSDAHYENIHEVAEDSKDNDANNNEGHLNDDNDQNTEEHHPINEDENDHYSIYEKEGEATKDFEQLWDTPRLKFKKLSDKPSKKKTAAAGVKRIAINTNMGILFRKDGIINKGSSKCEEVKETNSESNVTKTEHNESDMK